MSFAILDGLHRLSNVVLGTSALAIAFLIALARAGVDVFGVHLDRKSTLPHVERIVGEIRALGRQARFFNVNAADPDRRAEVADEIQKTLEARGQMGQLRVLLHSLAFGALKPFVAEPMTDALTPAQMAMTLDVMAHTLVYWAQDVVGRGLMARGGRIYAMTSSGSARVIPQYGAVSAAKAALESNVRQLAAELGPRGITANAIRAGVTSTPALAKIPGSDQLLAHGLRRNPAGRLTTPEDVAKAIVALSHPDTYWLTGNVIGVDGGEDVIG